MYRKEAVGSKKSNYTWKLTIFCEYVKFGAISGKIDILPITAEVMLKSENSFLHILLIQLWLYSAQQISFLTNRV